MLVHESTMPILDDCIVGESIGLEEDEGHPEHMSMETGESEEEYHLHLLKAKFKNLIISMQATFDSKDLSVNVQDYILDQMFRGLEESIDIY
jgi:hypothetical protein